jgi:hypothetical protein
MMIRPLVVTTGVLIICEKLRLTTLEICMLSTQTVSMRAISHGFMIQVPQQQKRRLELGNPDGDYHLPAPAAMHVSDTRDTLYLASSRNKPDYIDLSVEPFYRPYLAKIACGTSVFGCASSDWCGGIDLARNECVTIYDLLILCDCCLWHSP